VSVRDAPRWTRDGQTMVILSEREGWQQAYAVSRADRSTRLLTPSAADVISLLSTDAKDEWLYYLASPDNATQRYLFRSRLDGSGATERVTPAAQPGTHSYSISPDGSFAFHTYSTFNQPPVTRLVRLPSHEVVRLLEENRALREKNADLGPPGEFLTVAAGDGVTLDGWMIKPKAFEPGGKYPVVVFVYGEPASVTVTDNWGGSRTLFHRALAEAGFAVVSFDNRGTPAPKGRAWRKVIYGAVNVLAAKEQTTALQNLLRERPYLDASRVGVWGHSGGGANTLNLMFRSPETYQVGVSLAPVVDQRLYDTIYQERYMGLPAQNPDGYRDASPITHAAGLRGKLLLVHGAADDNVHYQHSEQLINRLIELQKPVDLMVYPSGTHALSEGKGYALHRHRLIANYFVEHLVRRAVPARQ
jgi:dipeptidyl-peptidase-4